MTERHLNLQQLDRVFIFLLSRKDINKKTLFKRLATARLFCICRKWNQLVWFWCLRQPSKTVLSYLPISSKRIDSDCLESWFFYTHPSYRWHGIASTIQKKLLKNTLANTIISVTRIDNIPMQKILQKCGFTYTGKSYFNAFLQKQVHIYMYTNNS